MVTEINDEKEKNPRSIDGFDERFETLQKKVEWLKTYCVSNHIPFFISVAFKNDEEGTRYLSEINSPTDAGVELNDDKITSMLNVMNGFDVVPPIYHHDEDVFEDF